MKVLLATSFHEHLAALAGFHLNWRAALSGRMVTMAHLSATTRRVMLAEMADANAFPSAEGLLVNPVSIPTRFGTALPMMIHNHRMAARIGLGSTHICLASPYLYALKSGLDREIEVFDCGLPANLYPPHSGWLWNGPMMADVRMTGLAAYLGAEMRVGRADGVFMTSDLFEALLAVTQRFFTIEEIAALDPIYPLEEVLFPTVLPALLGQSARIGTTRAKAWEPGDPPTLAKLQSAIASGLHASAKRIPQDPSHPIRQAVFANLPGEEAILQYLGSQLA